MTLKSQDKQSMKCHNTISLLVPLIFFLFFTSFLHASDNTLACKKNERLNNTYTPAELVPAFVSCIKLKKYNKSFYYYFLLDAYTIYDIQRVRDKTSHSVIDDLINQHFADMQPEELADWGEALSEAMNDKALIQDVCRLVIKLGKPSYHPDYMIQSGSAPNQPADDGLVPGHDPDALWQEIVMNQLKCQ